MTVVIIVAVLTLATAGLTFLTSLHTNRKAATKEQVQEVHVLVNSQLTAVVSRVTQLLNALNNAGVEVPEDLNGDGIVDDTTKLDQGKVNQ